MVCLTVPHKKSLPEEAEKSLQGPELFKRPSEKGLGPATCPLFTADLIRVAMNESPLHGGARPHAGQNSLSSQDFQRWR